MFKSRFLYTLALYLLLPFIPLRLLWRARKQPAYLQHWGERFGYYRTSPPAPLIWIHAVSVGETRASAPLIEALHARYPQYQILLTHMTPTGRETGLALFGTRVIQAYLPYDLPGAVRRFLTHFKPTFGLLMETELWPNLIATCRYRSISLALINARLSERSAQGYARFGMLAQLTKESLQALPLICAQSNADAARLTQLGASQVYVTGNIKFDVAVPADAGARASHLRAIWGGDRLVLILASTREGEETLLMDALSARASDQLLVIVPRHPQRFDAVATLLAAHGIRFQRRSENQSIRADTQVVLGDTMGEMFAYYGSADVAVIGGSFLPFGGQNLIEACAMALPVIVGQHTFNFTQIAEDAIAAGAALRATDAHNSLTLAQNLFHDAAARKRMGQAALDYAVAQRGAILQTMTMIEGHLLA